MTDRNTVLIFNPLLYELIKLTQRREHDPANPAGIIFLLDPCKLGQSEPTNIIDLLVVDQLPKVKDDDMIGSTVAKKKVEEFKVQEGLKPSGMVVVVQTNRVILVNFDKG